MACSRSLILQDPRRTSRLDAAGGIVRQGDQDTPSSASIGPGRSTERDGVVSDLAEVGVLPGLAVDPPWHSTRGELLAGLGQPDQAVAGPQAVSLDPNAAPQHHRGAR